MLDPNCGRVQANTHGRTSAIERGKIDGLAADIVERGSPGDGIRDQCFCNKPGDAAVTSGKHLLPGFVADVEWVQHVGSIGRISRKRVWAETVSSTLAGTQELADGLAADATALQHVVFERDGVQAAGDRISGIPRHGRIRAICRVVLDQFTARFFRNRGALPDFVSENPRAVRLGELGSKVSAVWS